MTSNAFSETVSVALGQVQVREDPFLALWELMPWLRKKRWFMEKEAVITGVEQADAVVLAPGPDPAVYALFVTFRLAADPDHQVPERQKRYFIPIILSSTGVPDVSAEDTVRLKLTDGILYLALAEHSKLYQEPWLHSLTAEETLVTQRGGRIRFQVFSPHLELPTGGLEAKSLNVSTSNVLTLVESGPTRWVDKTYKDLRGPSGEPGRRWQPNYEAMRYEALAQAGYPNVPPLYGLVFYEAPDGTVAALSAVMDVVDKEDEIGGIFWSALDQYVKAWVNSKAAQDEAFHRKHLQGAAAAAREIAKTIARMHTSFLGSTGASFCPVAASDGDLQRWSEAPLRDVEIALEILRKRQEAQPDSTLAVLIQKLERLAPRFAQSAAGGEKGALEGVARMLRERGQGLMKAQIHGDLHTAQGLITSGPGGGVISRFLEAVERGNMSRIQEAARELSGRVRWIDFEGVPAKNSVDDSEDGRDSPFLDLAGMAQAFCYIANLRLYEQLGLNPQDRAEDHSTARRVSLALAREMTPEEAAVPGLTVELIKLLDNWLTEVTSAFLDGYLDEAETCGLGEKILAPWDRNRAKALVYFWILTRAAHELRYETYARDWGWEAIPGGRILQILRNQNLAVDPNFLND